MKTISNSNELLEQARNLPNSGEANKDEIYSILELTSSGKIYIPLNQTLELLEILYEKDKTIFDDKNAKSKISKSLTNRLIFLKSLHTQNAFDTLFSSEKFSKQIARLIYEEINAFYALQLADAVVVKFKDESLADEILSKVKNSKITKDCVDKILSHSFSSQKVLFFICDEVFDTFPLEFALKSKCGREVILKYLKKLRDIRLAKLFCIEILTKYNDTKFANKIKDISQNFTQTRLNGANENYIKKYFAKFDDYPYSYGSYEIAGSSAKRLLDSFFAIFRPVHCIDPYFLFEKNLYYPVANDYRFDDWRFIDDRSLINPSKEPKEMKKITLKEFAKMLGISPIKLRVLLPFIR